MVVNTRLLKLRCFILGSGIEITDEPVSFEPAENGEFTPIEDPLSGGFEFYW